MSVCGSISCRSKCRISCSRSTTNSRAYNISKRLQILTTVLVTCRNVKCRTPNILTILALSIVQLFTHIYGFLKLTGLMMLACDLLVKLTSFCTLSVQMVLVESITSTSRVLTYRGACRGDNLPCSISSQTGTLLLRILGCFLFEIFCGFRVYGPTFAGIFDWNAREWLMRSQGHIYAIFLPSARRMRIAPKSSPNWTCIQVCIATANWLKIVVEDLLRAASVGLPCAKIARKLIIARSVRKLIVTNLLIILLIVWQLKQFLLIGVSLLNL